MHRLMESYLDFWDSHVYGSDCYHDRVCDLIRHAESYADASLKYLDEEAQRRLKPYIFPVSISVEEIARKRREGLQLTGAALEAYNAEAEWIRKTKLWREMAEDYW